MIACDFFCGAGGLTRGLLDAGIRVPAGFDCYESCRDTYERNNRGGEFVLAGLAARAPDELPVPDPIADSEDMLFAACAPCQPFSPQRKGGRSARDVAGGLRGFRGSVPAGLHASGERARH